MRSRLLIAAVAATAACSDPAPTRIETRAALSGRIGLSPLDGLNDMTRVRVDLGRGEGGAPPKMDGSFSFSDLEPDVYALTVTYAGSFEANAAQSAYLPFSLEVVATAGGSVNLGVIALELGTGTVAGAVELADGTSAEGAEVRLSADDVVRETHVTAERFEFHNVPVGHYALTVRRGVASRTACAAQVSLRFPGETVTSTSFVLDNARPAFSSGDTLATERNRWFLSSDEVSIAAVAGFATHGRVWREGSAAPGYAPFMGSFPPLTGLPEGETRVLVQFRDVCGFESETYELILVVDRTPPAIELVRLNGGEAYTRDRAVNLAIAATDESAAAMQMRIALCDGAGNCAPTIEQASWESFKALRPVTLPDRQGVHVAQVELQDRSGNRADVTSASIVYDSIAPENASVTIGGGAAVFHAPSVDILIDAVGAADMKIGEASGLANVSWRRFEGRVAHSFEGGDGSKVIYVRLRDAAGNETAEINARATLDTTAMIAGEVALEDNGDPADVEIVLTAAGTGTTAAFRTVAGAGGAWSLAAVPRGSYRLSYRGIGPAANRYALVQTFVSLAAGQGLQLPLQSILLARGTIAGTVTLENRTDHSGIAVEVEDVPDAVALTNQAGQYVIRGVPVATHVLRHGAEGFADGASTGVVVREGQATNVPAVQLAVLRGSLGGTFILEAENDHSNVQVSLTGTIFAATTSSTGQWSIPNVPAGFYDLVATPPRHREYRAFSVRVLPRAIASNPVA